MLLTMSQPDFLKKPMHDMTDAEWLEWYKTQPRGPRLTREEAIQWSAGRSRMLNPTEAERAVDKLLLSLPIDEDER